ncbi:flagellar biosynthetic protein FliO [Paraburkholderia caledonica]|jgi:flagellar protein FliO/FliZ|uniref:flagellar biosynthetic protein FliO n=1 Tax=Paraburkholderia caledonica TaxID=134536 RepID=UPI000DEFD5C7|nr:flagellar biosynthetic protein FliO [Paraburkholderia caledonica]AXF15813.1 flagellar biosynthetic protein FliO [Paraburkholderia caledonica]
MKTAVRRAVFPASRHVFSRAIGAALSATASFCAPFAAHAADMNAVNNAAKMASSVGAGTAVPALGVGAVLQTIVGLVVVIGLVFGCAWLARRFGLQPGSRSGLVKTIGGASLGGKERVAVVEIGDTWLVLGAAPGNVRLLHTMPAGSVAVDTIGNTQAGTPGVPGSSSAAGSTGLPGSFGQRFRDALKGEVSKRFNGQGNGVR